MVGLHSILQDTTQAASEIVIKTAIEFESVSRLLQSQQDDSSNSTTSDVDVYSQSQKMSLSMVQRFAGALSLMGGLYILWRALKRRRCAFDRIMLGLSVQTILWGIYHIWGNAAIPAGTADIYGAHGTTTTCTVQGFLFQITMVVPSYYVFLSCYSWAVVMHENFDPVKYEWVEKYIHVGVHIFPIASAVYLFEIEAFNANGLHCWIASIPYGCGDNSGIECTRGPQNPHQMLWIFGGLPMFFFLVFPTIVMVTLTFSVYKRQKDGTIPLVIPYSMVARQSAIYLGSLYWVYLPLFVYFGLNYYQHAKNYGVDLWVSIISVSLGLWIAIVYWYFTAEDPRFASECTEDTNAGSSPTNAVDATDPVEAPSNTEKEHVDNDRNDEFKMHKSKSGSRWSIKTNAMIRRRSSFNIFDGTASSGMFAAFVFDGDSDDEEKDMAESKQWANCQTMIGDQ